MIRVSNTEIALPRILGDKASLSDIKFRPDLCDVAETSGKRVDCRVHALPVINMDGGFADGPFAKRHGALIIVTVKKSLERIRRLNTRPFYVVVSGYKTPLALAG